MILLIDNYDSFVFNLARYLEELGEAVEVARNDTVTVEGARRAAPTHVVISPGPCTPGEAGVSVELIRALAGTAPILGVCLGHQCIAEAFGGVLRRGRRPMHGIVSEIQHGGEGLFDGLPSPLSVTRYHSLVVDPERPGEEVRITARAADGTVMAIEHERLPVWGVQFHPEAVLTFGGHRLLANFLALGRGEPAGGEGRPEASASRELRVVG